MRQKPNSQRGELREPTRPSTTSNRPPLSTAIWRQWILGILGSWTVVWLIGPFVLDSILVRVTDPELGVETLRPGDLIRWRSEGWGNTRIGPHGTPGWQPRQAPHRVVLWGDSQVEGVCVDDPEKINNQVNRIAHDRWQLELDCISMGRSGADARQWRDLMHDADALWNPALHIWVVTELSDLTALVLPGDSVAYRRWAASPPLVKAADAIRAEAVMAAAKRLLRDADNEGLRRLNFGIGPRAVPAASTAAQPAVSQRMDNGIENDQNLSAVVAEKVIQISRHFENRLVIVYAPATPAFDHGLRTVHADDAMYEAMCADLIAGEVATIDVRNSFLALWHSQQRLPRGFHNGMPGHGHLNADGNHVIAEAIVMLLQDVLSAD